jgi:hypothetical protein
VPAGEYRSVVRSLRRAKWLAASGLLVVAAIFAPLALIVSHDFVVPALVLLAVFYYWFLPSHRKRLLRIYNSLPRWEIEADSANQELPPGALGP